MSLLIVLGSIHLQKGEKADAVWDLEHLREANCSLLPSEAMEGSYAGPKLHKLLAYFNVSNLIFVGKQGT